MQSRQPRKEAVSPAALQTMFILDQCAAIETKCGEIYRHFAELCKDHPELETLWKKTAHEEDHHALQFRMLSRLKGEGIAGVNLDVSSVTNALKKVEDLFRRIKASRISAVDMLKVAIRLETNLSRYHSNSVVACEEPELKQLLDSMMNFDLDHAQMLQKALDKLEGGMEEGEEPK